MLWKCLLRVNLNISRNSTQSRWHLPGVRLVVWNDPLIEFQRLGKFLTIERALACWSPPGMETILPQVSSTDMIWRVNYPKHGSWIAFHSLIRSGPSIEISPHEFLALVSGRTPRWDYIFFSRCRLVLVRRRIMYIDCMIPSSKFKKEGDMNECLGGSHSVNGEASFSTRFSTSNSVLYSTICFNVQLVAGQPGVIVRSLILLFESLLNIGRVTAARQ